MTRYVYGMRGAGDGVRLPRCIPERQADILPSGWTRPGTPPARARV